MVTQAKERCKRNFKPGGWCDIHVKKTTQQQLSLYGPDKDSLYTETKFFGL
jgi:hypothetical protein